MALWVCMPANGVGLVGVCGAFFFFLFFCDGDDGELCVCVG